MFLSRTSTPLGLFDDEEEEAQGDLFSAMLSKPAAKPQVLGHVICKKKIQQLMKYYVQ